jgi:hypothetical protein
VPCSRRLDSFPGRQYGVDPRETRKAAVMYVERDESGVPTIRYSMRAPLCTPESPPPIKRPHLHPDYGEDW